MIFLNILPMDIPFRLAQARKKQGLTQLDFAKKIGIARGSLINYEKGESELPVNVAKSIQATFGIRYEWLLTGEGEMLLSEQQSETLSSNKENDDNDSGIIRRLELMLDGMMSRLERAEQANNKRIAELEAKLQKLEKEKEVHRLKFSNV